MMSTTQKDYFQIEDSVLQPLHFPMIAINVKYMNLAFKTRISHYCFLSVSALHPLFYFNIK